MDNRFPLFFEKYRTTIIISLTASILTGIIASALTLGFIYIKLKEQTAQPISYATSTPKASETQPGILSQLESSEQKVVKAVRRANPAVVSIVISKDVPILEQYYEETPGFNDPFFEQFFGDGFNPFSFKIPKYREKGTEKKEVGGGSGFLVSRDGMVVTNRHVVDQKNVEYTVFTNDGVKHKATVIARDPVYDVAILKIDGSSNTYLDFANSDKVEVGQIAIAIGNALAEFRNTVSVGVVSGLARSITAGDNFGRPEQLENVIQTDAAINPGNSGGPLLNSEGKVIGVNVAMVRGSQNIGFALPANIVKSIVTTVKEKGKIVRPFLGIRYIAVTKELKEKNKLPVDYGALVARGEQRDELAVIPGSPADKVGIVENDIILEIDGTKLTSTKTLANLIRSKQVGDKVKLKILHRGAEKIVELVLTELPE